MSSGNVAGYIALGVVLAAVGITLLMNPGRVRQRFSRAPERFYRRLIGDRDGCRWSYRLMDSAAYWLVCTVLGIGSLLWGLIHV